MFSGHVREPYRRGQVAKTFKFFVMVKDTQALARLCVVGICGRPIVGVKWQKQLFFNVVDTDTQS